jgi:hypothetical protein
MVVVKLRPPSAERARKTDRGRSARLRFPYFGSVAVKAMSSVPSPSKAMVKYGPLMAKSEFHVNGSIIGLPAGAQLRPSSADRWRLMPKPP